MTSIGEYVGRTLDDPGLFYDQVDYAKASAATVISPELIAYAIDDEFDRRVFGNGDVATFFTNLPTSKLALVTVEAQLDRLHLTPFVSELTSATLGSADRDTPSTSKPPTTEPTSLPPSSNKIKAKAVNQHNHSRQPTTPEEPKNVALRPYSHPAPINPTLLHVTVKATVEPLQTLAAAPPIAPRQETVKSTRHLLPISPLAPATPSPPRARRRQSMVEQALPRYIKSQLKLPPRTSGGTSGVYSTVVEEELGVSGFIRSPGSLLLKVPPPLLDVLDFDEEYISPALLSRFYGVPAPPKPLDTLDVDFITINDLNDDDTHDNDYLFNL